MSILFPKVPKPRGWDYRPIYYDEEKEQRKERLRELQLKRDAAEGKKTEVDENYRHGLRRGAFRDAAERNKSERIKQSRKTKIRVWLIALMLLAILWFFLA